MLKEKIYDFMVKHGIVHRVFELFHYYSMKRVEEELRKEKVRDLSLEGLIIETPDYKGEPSRIYKIAYLVNTEDNNPLLFVEYHKVEAETPVTAKDYQDFNVRLKRKKERLTELFEREGNYDVDIIVNYCDVIINNPKRDSEREDVIFQQYFKRRRERYDKWKEENKKAFRCFYALFGTSIGVIGAGIIYATCFMPRTIENAKVVSIEQEEIMNVKAGSVSNWYRINVDKHDDCLITSEEIGAGLKVGDSLKEIKWNPLIGECDYMTNYEK